MSVSSTYVSRCTAQLDASLEQWRNRPIPPISFLSLDATYLKVRSEGCIRDCAALMATGICEGSGKRMVLGVSVSSSEASQHWKSFILSLLARGMNRPLCVTSDDHYGIRSALAQSLTGVPWQRCQFHFQRNAASFISRKSLKPLVASLVRTIFNAPDMQTATLTLHTTLSSLRGMQQHDLADWIEENIHECLTVLNFPLEIRRHIRTSNCMENLNRQCKRRTNVISIFPSVKALLRIVTAKAADISDEWEGIHGRVIIPPNTLNRLRGQTPAASAPVPPPTA